MGHVPGSSSGDYTYHPRSDCMFLLDSCRFLIVEVNSSSYAVDQPQMLLQGGLLVCVMNSIKMAPTELFVCVAIYITSHFLAR